MDMFSYLLGRSSGGGGGKGLKIEIVTELPETGEANILYLVPRQVSKYRNVFDEYLWINETWEMVGTTDIDISGKQDKMQFATMPTANLENVGKIVQYIGTTNANYTNGYFYICLSDGAVTPTYSWKNLNVQPSNCVVITSTNRQDSNILEMLNVEYQKYLSKKPYNVMLYLSQPSYQGGKDILVNAYFKRTNYYSVNDVTLESNIMLLHKSGNSSFGVVEAIITYNNNNIITEIGLPRQTERFATDTSGTRLVSIGNSTPYTPTGDYNPATKKYVDDSNTQVTTMPTASANNLGKIVQYTGADTQDYTNGYFYQVVSDGAATPTYSWEQLDVQPSSGGFDEYYPDIISLKTGDTSSQTISKIESTINRLISQGKRNFYVLLSGEVYSWAGIDIGLILTGRIYDTANPNPTGSPRTNIDCIYFGGMPLSRRTNIARLQINGTWDANSQHYTVSSINYGYNGSANYYFIDRDNNTAYTPTAPYNPATRLYVDQLKVNAAGFINVYQRDVTYAVDDKVYVVDYSSTQKGNPRYFICNTAHTTTDNYISQDIANWDEYFPTQDELLLANKKYVDDLVGNINTILATLTTPSNNGGN